MELRHLTHFLAVAQEGSFTRAAARLHIVQSALSVSIKSLERELGAKLFDRTTHRVELTGEGRALQPEAVAILAAVETARDAVAAVQGGVRGTLRIGLLQSQTLVDMAALLTRFHAERPNVRLEPRFAVTEGSSSLAEQVLDGRLDIALSGLPQHPAGLTVYPLSREPLVMVCSREHRLVRRRLVTVADLASERFIESPLGWGPRTLSDQLFHAAGTERDMVVDVPDIPTIVELVRAGLGIALLPALHVKDDRNLALVKLRGAPDLVTSLIVRADRPPTAASAAFIALARQTYPEPA